MGRLYAGLHGAQRLIVTIRPGSRSFQELTIYLLKAVAPLFRTSVEPNEGVHMPRSVSLPSH
jgi:hypothetical protein